MFEPFFTTKADGLGMGLAISRSIVQSHDGRIWAENDPAGGAVFRVRLPTERGAASERSPAGEARALPASQGERELESEDERVGDLPGSAGIDDVLKVRLHLQPAAVAWMI